MNLIDRGEASWQLHALDAAEPLMRAIESCRGLAQSTGCEILLDEPLHSALIETDPDRLQQVVINILTNAIKHNTSAKPAVKVAGRFADRQYMIEISDNGPGIPGHLRPFIFEKFQRRAAQSSTGGSASGLPSAKKS